MAISRYLAVNGPRPNTKSMSAASAAIRRSVALGEIKADSIVLEEGQRLDQLAGQYYGDANYWWIIAAASGIGWGLQVPPGTIIVIPRYIGDVLSFVL